MLVGTYEHRFDPKGRIVLPSKFRDELGENPVATVGIDQCVSIYPADKWQALLERFQKMSFSKGRTRDFLRVLLATAHEIQFDASGRVLVPVNLRQHARVEQDATVIGVGDHIEIWDSGSWNIYLEGVKKELPDIAEEVEGL
ncbi:MAG TPA: division/cell wall cluster transcriptional repressor MraZ [Synergistales bacterium]|jgi:MraZ protein|nr:division/cell wall cluster transcriptional repressor MraZ [Synergistales bacterium]HRV70532.1 division/cell wall cluster transcriptional repressor MraZ [Thermovirgaceae bacterium]